MTDLLSSNFSDIADISSKPTISTKHSSSLVHTRNTFNSNSNRNSNSNNNNNNNNNSNSNNKNIKVIDARIKEIDQANPKINNTTGQGVVGKIKKKKVGFLFNYDPKQDISASVSKSAKSIDNININDDDDVPNTKQSSSLAYTRNTFNINSNSNSNNKNVKVVDARIKEIDQANPKVNNTTGQGIVGNLKKKKIVSLFNYDSKQDISVSVSTSTKRINNNNNNDDDDFYNTKQSSSLVNTRNNFNSNSNSNNKKSK